MQRHNIAAALVSLAALACTQSFSAWEKEYEAARMKSEAVAVRRATEQAQATLDDFLVKAKQPPAGTTSYALKVEIREGRNREFFWVNEFSWTDVTFTGKINSEPRLVKTVKPGQVHRFGRSDIVDWTYVDERNGRTFGNFIACALSGKEPPARADGSRSGAGSDCS